jgi:hypothetical protein
MLVSCRIWLVFVSKNWMQNMLMFSSGMGFNILGLLLFDAGTCFFDIMLLDGISRHIGKWSEFCLRFSIVLDVNAGMFEGFCCIFI